MYNRFNTRNLVIVFGVLLAAVLLTLAGGNKKNRSFDSQVSGFDPGLVTEFNLYPRAGGEMIRFRKTDERWMVAGGSGEYNGDAGQVDRMLQSISSLQALRLAARERDAWEKYQVTDSLGTRVEVMAGDKTLADLVMGKFSYAQPRGPVNPYQQQQQGSITTYVRRNGEKEVFAVDGFLAMSFNGRLKDFRDPMVLQTSSADIRDISLSLPGGSYELVRNDSVWLCGGIIADSAGMAGYLSQLNRTRHPHFLGEDRAPAGQPTHQLMLRGEGGVMLAQVDAWYVDSLNIAMRSSINPGTWFDGSKQEVFGKLFREQEAFLK